MNIQTERQANQLLDRILALDEVADNTFVLKSIENDAKKLLKSDAAQAYMILGIVASVKGNVEECQYNFSRSIDLYDSSLVRVNYGVSLVRLGLMRLSYEQVEKALNMADFDIKIYGTAIQVLLLTGYPKKAAELGHALNKAQAEINAGLKEAIDNAEKLAALNLPDDYFSTMMSIVSDLLVKFKTTSKKTEFIFDLPDAPATCRIQTDLNSEQTVEMSMDFYDILAEKHIDSSLFKAFTVLFRSAA